MIDVSSQLRLVFYVALNSCLFFFADMNSLDWALPMGRKSRDSWGASSSEVGKGARMKRGREDQPPSPVIRVSFWSSGQRREQLPPRPSRVFFVGKSVVFCSELSDSMAHYSVEYFPRMSSHPYIICRLQT